jgi:hypothetical protein
MARAEGLRSSPQLTLVTELTVTSTVVPKIAIEPLMPSD